MEVIIGGLIGGGIISSLLLLIINEDPLGALLSFIALAVVCPLLLIVLSVVMDERERSKVS